MNALVTQVPSKIPAAAEEPLRAVLGKLKGGACVDDVQAQVLAGTGQRLMSLGRHQEALACFHLLVVLRPAHPNYLAALAAAYRASGRLEDALTAYRYLDLLDPGKPEHTLSIADCLLQLKRNAEAAYLLGVVIHFCLANDRAPAVLRKAQALFDLLGHSRDTVD